MLLGGRARPLYAAATIAAVAGLAVALILGFISDTSLRRFFFAYLASFVFFLSISIGALIMVLLQFLTRAAWSVGVRRIAEHVAGIIPVLGLLSIPLIATVLIQRGTVYRWALPLSASTPEARAASARGEAEEEPESVPTPSQESVHTGAQPAAPTLDAVTLQKRAWVNPWFWTVRVVGCFIVLSLIARWYRRQSLLQDETGDFELTRRMQIWSGLCVIIVGLAATSFAGDLIMSLDPHWYSTMFGVYYIVGGILGSWATLILIASLLRGAGYLTRSITVEHFHDLGKYMFGFTFFWGYIAFSQYMLLWYANIPEEIEWFNRHGATTVPHNVTGWSYVILALLFGQLIIPFAGLMSRHVKRRLEVLTFWACWVLTFHLLDSYWLVMPEYHAAGGPHWSAFSILIDLAAFLGIGGVFVATLLRNMAPYSLRPVADPRLPEALAFHNI